MFFSKSVRSVVFFSLIVLVPAFAFAEESVVLVEGNLGQVFSGFGHSAVRSLATQPTTFQALSPVELSLHLPSGETALLRLSENLRRYWPAYFVSEYGITEDSGDVLLFRGEYHEGEQSFPLAGAVYMHEGQPTLFLDFPASDGVTYYKLRIPVINGEASVGAALEAHNISELEHMSCASHDEDLARSAPRSPRLAEDTVGIASLRALEIATEADYEYSSRYGTETNAHIAALINAADTIYQRDLSVDIRIATQHAVTTSSQPYTSTASSTLLSQFQSYTIANSQLGSADLYHLFTGKDIDGSVIGIAYLGVACSSPSYSYGLTQDIGSLSYLVFAHEVGHNLGADHDVTTGVTIMAPALNSAANSFSTISQNEISAYISSYGSCLSSVSGPDPGDGGGSPDPSPTPEPTPDPRTGSLSLSASFDQDANRVSITVQADDMSASDCHAYVRMASDSTMVSGRTAAWGRSGSTTITGSAKNKKRTSSLIYVQASYSCPSLDTTLYSDVQSINPGLVRSNQKLTSEAKWIKSSLSSAAKSAKKRGNNS